MNNTNDMNNLMELSKQTALNISSISDQMGIVTTKVKQLSIESRENREGLKALRQDFEDEKERNRLNEYIDPSQVQELDEALKNRVSDICNDHNCFDLFGKLKRKGWNDAKKYSNVVGKAGVYTKRIHFESAVEYLATWSPHGWGILGYIKHLRGLEKTA